MSFATSTADLVTSLFGVPCTVHSRWSSVVSLRSFVYCSTWLLLPRKLGSLGQALQIVDKHAHFG